MKKTAFILNLLIGMLMMGCVKGGAESGNEENVIPGQSHSVKGSVQKGPFIQGSAIIIQALDSNLNPTGKIYQTKTIDDKGAFLIDGKVESQYIEIIADGYYFNENKGQVSSSTLTLRALSDLEEEGQTNVNILTTLEFDRISYLVSECGLSVKDAREQAEQEILNVFNVNEAVIGTTFDRLDITKEGNVNAILLAISTTLQADRSEGELSELISKIAADISSDGIVSNDLIKQQIKDGCMGINAQKVRANLENRYKKLGVSNPTIPPFEDYLDINGNGVVDKLDKWLILDKSEFVVSDEGETLEIELQYNVDYTIEVDDNDSSWIQCGQTRSYLETSKLILTVSANDTYDPRFARVTLREKDANSPDVCVAYINITQKQKDALLVSKNRFEIPKEGGVIDLQVKSNVAYSVEIPAEYSNWISQEQTRGLESSTIQFHIAANQEPDVRQGKIIIQSNNMKEEVALYQLGERTLILNQHDYVVSDKGDVVMVELLSNIDYEIQISDSWISEVKQTRGLISGTHSFSVAPNDNYESRVAHIVFKDKMSSMSEMVTITQTQRDAIIVAKDSYAFDNSAHTLTADVQSNVPLQVEIPDGCKDWISEVITRSLETHTLSFSIKENLGYEKREGEIIIKNNQSDLQQTIKIYQAQKDAIILSKNLYNFTSDGGNFTLEISSNIDYKVSISANGNWIHQVQTRAMVNSSLGFVVDENTLYDNREAIIEIKNVQSNISESVRVVQEQKNAILADSTNYNVSYEGGVLDINISSNVSYDINSENLPSWIKLIPETRGLTNHSVSFSIDRNSDVVERSANVVFRNVDTKLEMTITITQAGSEDWQIVHVETVETLGDILTDSQKMYCKRLKLTGNIYIADFATIENMPALTELDLSEVTVKSNVIPEEALGHCKDLFGLIYSESKSNLETIILPESIIGIGQYAFAGCKRLRQINLPEKMSVIDAGVFMDTSLESIAIPAKVNTICRMAFAGCENLAEVNFPEDSMLKKLLSGASNDPLGHTSSFGAFQGCKSLKRFELPSGVTSIGVNTFEDCSSLEEFIIPDDIALTELQGYYYKDNSVIGSKPVTGGLMEGCWALKSLHIPAKITKITTSAFANTGIQEVTFAEGSQCTTLGDGAFYGSVYLHTIELPETIKTLGNLAFGGCLSLDYLDLSNVESFGMLVCKDCEYLRKVVLSSDVTTMPHSIFSGCTRLEVVEGCDNLERIEQSAFENCEALKNIPQSLALKVISENAFRGCKGLTNVVLPSSTYLLDRYIFEDCTSLESFSLSDNEFIYLNDDIFKGCSKLTNIRLNAKMVIANKIFRGTNISEFEIPAIVESWAGCAPCRYSVYGNVSSEGEPSIKYDDYGCAEFEYSELLGYRYAFFNCPFTDSLISTITFEEGSRLKECGRGAFGGAQYLTNITLPESVETLGGHIFSGCRYLTSWSIPKHVKRITGPVFSGSSIIDGMVEEDGANLEYLGPMALMCAGNARLDLSKCSEIHDGALSYCPNLKEIKFKQDGEISLGDFLLIQTPGITEFTIPAGVTAVRCMESSPFYGSYVKRIQCEPNSLLSSISHSIASGAGGTWAGETWYWEGNVEEVDFSNAVCETFEFVKEGNYFRNRSLKEFKLPHCKNLVLNGMLFGSTRDNGSPNLTKLVLPKSITNITGSSIGGCFVEIVREEGGEALSIECSLFEDMTTLKTASLPGLTVIEKKLFQGCTSLTNFTIPESVTSIGERAFYGCTAMSSITIPESITSIGKYAFYHCGGEAIIHSKIVEADYLTSDGSPFYGSKFTKVTIGDNIEKIGESVFKSCTSLTDITIPEGVTSIGERAFYNCTSLTDITIPGSVTSIGNSAFYGCTSLANITIPEGVTSIGNRAFYGCTSLTNITIPEGVTSIGESAFYNCTSLTDITIPGSVTSIGSSAFYGCDALPIIDNIRYADTYLISAIDKTLSKYTIREGTRFIGAGAFSDCTSLESITIPESVTSIGKNAFSNCSGEVIIYGKIFENDYTNSNGSRSPFYGTKFTKITIGDNVEKIGAYVFSGCTSLTSVTIPESVTSIGNSVFSGCTSLTDITIPESVTSIGEYAFSGCKAMSSITIPESITSIGKNAFFYCGGELIIHSKIVETDYTSSSSGSFSGSDFTKITIGDNIEKIGAFAFYRCTSLTGITIPESVTSIGKAAFYNCTSLTDITIPGSVTSIGESVFYNCTSLANVTIPGSVTSIGKAAFINCTSLTDITIPGSVTSIGESAFYKCSNLAQIYCKPTTPPSLGSSAFSYGPTGRQIYVPSVSVDAYKTASSWKGYASIIVGYDF